MAGGECVVLVVEDDIGEVVIPTARVKEMSETDPVSVPVSSDADDCKFRVRKFYAERKRNGPPVEGFRRIAVNVLGGFPRASDTGDYNNLLLRDPEFLDGFSDGGENNEISASGTPLYEI